MTAKKAVGNILSITIYRRLLALFNVRKANLSGIQTDLARLILLFLESVMTERNRPTNIRDRRRCRFADLGHERDNQQWHM